MRGLHTQVSDLRKDVFVEVARIAYESDNINDDLESIDPGPDRMYFVRQAGLSLGYHCK